MTHVARYRLTAVSVLTLLLVACSSVEERQDRAKDFVAGSGSTVATGGLLSGLQSIRDFAASTVQTVTDVVSGVRGRVQKIQSGAELLMEGTELIQEGVTQ